mgnify:CR=1 FL=1
MREYKCHASWTYNEKTWAEDGWTKLYTVSDLLNTKWSAYVNTYNKAYKGSDMFDAMINAIREGTAKMMLTGA